jgi:hypothetical protein
LRSEIARAERENLTEPQDYAYDGGFLVRVARNFTDVGVYRCHGRPLTVPGPREPTRHIEGINPAGHHELEPLEPGSPNQFDLRYGIVTWSTGWSILSSPFQAAVEFGTLTSFRVSDGRRWTWKLPNIRLYAGGENERGVYGYAEHTLNAVFWLAARDVTGGEVGPCCVETSYLYSAGF